MNGGETGDGERRRRRRRRGAVGGESQAQQPVRPERGTQPRVEGRKPQPQPQPQRQSVRPERAPQARVEGRRPQPQPTEPRPSTRPRSRSGLAQDERTSALDGSWDDELGAASQRIPVVEDDDSPAPEITLGADLPAEPGDDELDPASADAGDVGVTALGQVIASVAGVRLVPTGKIYWCDAGAGAYQAGDVVVVDGERSTRIATIAVAPARRAVPERPARHIVRKADENDRATQAREHAHAAEVLRLARDKARALGLPCKVFRVEYTQPPGGNGRGGKLNLYYTSDERLELRDLLRDLGSATGARIELRQVGVRDEAKHVGGIGSCGLELCCSTWLPDFVPVSIKMAKDQGLVLNPTKVSGQCGRLKCCLVYEQATYAEMRKGLPKLGKRVITATGEGRVVEVDVLRQRVRVAYGPGESVVLPAGEVKPMFPAQHAGLAEPEPEPEPETDSEPEPDLP